LVFNGDEFKHIMPQFYYNQIEIVTLKSKEGIDVFWTFHANIIASLGLGGMREDDSGDKYRRNHN
jgi:hypothetical protein